MPITKLLTDLTQVSNEARTTRLNDEGWVYEPASALTRDSEPQDQFKSAPAEEKNVDRLCSEPTLNPFKLFDKLIHCNENRGITALQLAAEVVGAIALGALVYFKYSHVRLSIKYQQLLGSSISVNKAVLRFEKEVGRIVKLKDKSLIADKLLHLAYDVTISPQLSSAEKADLLTKRGGAFDNAVLGLENYRRVQITRYILKTFSEDVGRDKVRATELYARTLKDISSYNDQFIRLRDAMDLVEEYYKKYPGDGDETLDRAVSEIIESMEPNIIDNSLPPKAWISPKTWTAIEKRLPHLSEIAAEKVIKNALEIKDESLRHYVIMGMVGFSRKAGPEAADRVFDKLLANIKLLPDIEDRTKAYISLYSNGEAERRLANEVNISQNETHHERWMVIAHNVAAVVEFEYDNDIAMASSLYEKAAIVMLKKGEVQRAGWAYYKAADLLARKRSLNSKDAEKVASLYENSAIDEEHATERTKLAEEYRRRVASIAFGSGVDRPDGADLVARSSGVEGPAGAARAVGVERAKEIEQAGKGRDVEEDGRETEPGKEGPKGPGRVK